MSDEVGEERAPRAREHEALFIRASGRAFAIPLSFVRETMRPLPVERLPELPAFVRGLARVRGRLVPVVVLSRLVGDEVERGGARRFVSLEVNGGAFVLEVDEVRGLGELDQDQLEGLPPLARGLDGSVVAAVRVRDAELLFVLEATRLLPEELASSLDPGRSR